MQYNYWTILARRDFFKKEKKRKRGGGGEYKRTFSQDIGQINFPFFCLIQNIYFPFYMWWMQWMRGWWMPWCVLLLLCYFFATIFHHLFNAFFSFVIYSDNDLFPFTTHPWDDCKSSQSIFTYSSPARTNSYDLLICKVW